MECATFLVLMSRDLDLAVDRASEVPVGTQLAWKLRTLIGRGELAAGARLPGIRELAEIEPLSGLAKPAPEAQPRVLSAAELRDVRDALAARIYRLEQERRQWRAENERARAEQEAAVERPRTRHWGAGVWTGRAGAEVSWTTA